MHIIVAFIIGRLAWLLKNGRFPGDGPEVAPRQHLTPRQHLIVHRQHVAQSHLYTNIGDSNRWKNNLFSSMRANVRKIKHHHQNLQAALRKLINPTYSHLSLQLAQNSQSRRRISAIISDRQRANKKIAKYMTKLIKDAAALHIILTYYYNEIPFDVRDEEDVEVIELLHSFYPLRTLVQAHYLTDSLSQSIIRSSLETGINVVCNRVIGEGEHAVNLYTFGRNTIAPGHIRGFVF